MKNLRAMTVALATTLFVAGTSVASAATLTTAACGSARELSAVTLTQVDATGGLSLSADRCIYVDGNDINSGKKATLLPGLQSGALFDLSDAGWSVLGKSDDAGSGVTADNRARYGDWSIDAGAVIDLFVVTLKAGSNYAAFLFEGVGQGTAFSGTFDFSLLTDNPGFKIEGKKLSHLGAATAAPVQIVPTPLPAAGWMLIASVAGLGALRRFRGQRAVS
ncbi:VPLPA-CTERM sorting domain-containing protein [uncultured Roseobacter sp.]|uniref:VPLPA-CTERM sorting domain-containing protein n=1 Tax=uncultured Roseobacter sp. TaxID=114847 RepID=UPI0026060733|nr:VPLPA-CTERM sorting domain-containing protein [uncultured Roseobacter sp.]